VKASDYWKYRAELAEARLAETLKMLDDANLAVGLLALGDPEAIAAAREVTDALQDKPVT
jgi:hypothetical protein